MKIAIFSDDNNASFIKLMATGLMDMLNECGQEVVILDKGLTILSNPHSSFLKMIQLEIWVFINDCISLLSGFLRETYSPISFSKKNFLLHYNLLKNIYQIFIIKFLIKKFDLIIIITVIPGAFLQLQYPYIERIRDKFKKPIVLYQNYCLPTRGEWIKNILENYPGKNFGLERFDYYLCSSAVSEWPMPKKFTFFSIIGINLNDNSLFPEKNDDFLAVLDFPREGFEKEREIQINALIETKTKFIQLLDIMTTSEIRKIYRATNMFFLSFRESFGVPIVELQLCGAYICVPYKNWAPSHYINKSIYESGEGDLSSNFIIYNNDKEILKEKISLIKSSYNSEKVIEEFREKHPHLYSGDLGELQKFLERVKTGDITGKSHETYFSFNNEIIEIYNKIKDNN